MSKRGKGKGRKPKRRFMAWKKPTSDLPTPHSSLTQSDLVFVMRPETRLVIGVGQLLLNYACEKFLPHYMQSGLIVELGDLTEEMRAKMEAAIKSQIIQHPEAKDPIKTSINERQEGRSEVIREIANPKRS